MGTLYFYDSSMNVVTELNRSVDFGDFSTDGGYPNQFWIGERTDDKMDVYSSEGEFLLLWEERQTREQAVILFATLLGLRAAASDI